MRWPAVETRESAALASRNDSHNSHADAFRQATPALHDGGQARVGGLLCAIYCCAYCSAFAYLIRKSLWLLGFFNANGGF